MTNFTTPHPTDLAGIFAVQSTLTALQQLFLNSYQELRQAVQDAGPSLMPQDADHILESCADHISDYHGPLEGFIEWMTGVAQDSAHHAETFLTMRGDPENVKAVRAAIGSILKGCSELGVDEGTLDELESDFWTGVLMNLAEWMMPSWSKDGKRPPATMPTRLFGAAKFAAMAWKSTQVREKARYAELPDKESEEKDE